MSPSPRLVVALDVADAQAARQASETLMGHVDMIKIGLELFVGAGRTLVSELRDEGWGIFLDLKLHDIPATVAGAVRSAAALGVDLLTLHASGGARMIEAAAAARGDLGPRLLAVTVLTSIDTEELERLGVSGTPAAVVERFAQLAHENGCDGVVASVNEAAEIKTRYGEAFLVATPGIRSAGAALDDQARIATVAQAIEAGSDYLVVGRPILKAENPAAAADAIRAEMERVHARS